MLNFQVECAWPCSAETEVAEQKVNKRGRGLLAGGGAWRGTGPGCLTWRLID